jgi:hypothetical protein
MGNSILDQFQNLLLTRRQFDGKSRQVGHDGISCGWALLDIHGYVLY